MKRILANLLLMIIISTTVGAQPTGFGAYTKPITTNFVPGVPRSFQATATFGRVDLSWAVPLDIFGDAETDILNYTIQRKTGVGGAWSDLTTLNAITHADGFSLTPSTTYYYRIRANDSAASGAWSSEVNATPTADLDPPTTPTSPSGSVTNTTIEFSWGASTDVGGSGVENYSGTISTSSNHTVNVTPFTTTTLSYSFSGSASTLYYFRVRAKDYSGNYSSYATTSATTGLAGGNPQISSATTLPGATFSNNAIITLVGSNFGSRNVSDLYVRDTFESGSFSSDWDESSYTAPYSMSVVSKSRGASSKCAYGNITDYPTDSYTNYQFFRKYPNGSSSPPTSRKHYTSLWLWFDPNFTFEVDDDAAAPWECRTNMKMFRWMRPQSATGCIGNDGGGGDENWMIVYHGIGGSQQLLVANEYMNPVTQFQQRYYSINTSTIFSPNNWHFVEYITDEVGGVIDSDGQKGSVKMYVDGVLVIDDTTTCEFVEDCSNTKPTLWNLGFHVTNNDLSIIRSDATNEWWMDDPICQSSWARVMIGNDSIYSSCTVREFQSINNWTNNQISFTMSSGLFTTDQTVYVFVINDQGTPSTGFPIIVGASNGPTITGTSIAGNVITLTGINFGTKSTPAPIIFDNFEDGIDGNQIVSTAQKWDTVVPVGEGNTPIYSTSSAHGSGLGMYCRMDLGGSAGISAVHKYGNFSNYAYFDYYFRIEPGANSTALVSRSVKPIVCYGSNSCDMPQPVPFQKLSETGNNAQFCVGLYHGHTPGCEYGYSHIGAYLPRYETFFTKRHMQILIKMSNNIDNNGYIKVWIDGVQVVNNLNEYTQDETIGSGYMDQVVLGNFRSYEDYTHDLPPYPYVEARRDRFHWDNVYIDNTPARIEIGNNSSYTSCTQREIQIPITWGTQQITATLNAGTLTGANYIFVIDSNGNVSGGYPITMPTINDATISSGTITITGAGFGTKSPAPPILWDNFDAGPDGTSLDSKVNWIGWTGGGGGIGVPTDELGGQITSSNPYGGTGLSVKNAITTSESGKNFNTSYFDYPAREADEVYFTYVHKRDVPNPPVDENGNVTKHGHVGTQVDRYDGPGVAAISFFSTYYQNGPRLAGESEQDHYHFGSWHDWSRTTWSRHEIYKKNSVPAGALNGEVHFEMVGSPSSIRNEKQIITRAAGQTWKNSSVWLPLAIANVTEDQTMWVDNVYVDDTRARVEIGNQSTFSECTIREIQIPITWSSQQITATLNKGTLSTGTNYLFVIDSSGNVSIGKQITIP